jgi:hypothetical protein
VGFVETQHDLQLETYGIDLRALRGAERARFVRDMVLACEDELHEILHLVHWKPWHEGRLVYGADVEGLEEAKTEFGDIMCFIGNLAGVFGLTTKDVMEGFELKVEKNRVRHDINTRGEQ